MKNLFNFKQLLLTLVFAFASLVMVSGACFAGADGVSYSAHVEDYGWRDPVSNGETAGTTGESKRVEALKISLVNPNNLGVTYQVHVQDTGWMDPVSDGAVAGTEGQSKRVEALNIKLTGEDAPNYNIYYRVHSQDIGWLGWAKDGENAGTAKKALRVEAVEIKLQKAGEPAPEPLGNSYQEGEDPAPAPEQPSEPVQDDNFFIKYKVMMRDNWSGYAQDGTSLGGDQIDAFSASLPARFQSDGGLQYRTLHSDVGWLGWLNGSDDMASGVPGHAMQAIRIRLTDKLAHMYDIYYRVHAPNVGWSNWAKNGEACGSEGYGRPITFIEVKFTNKGDLPGTDVGNAFSQPRWLWPLPNAYRNVVSPFGPRNDNHHDGIDITAPEWTPCYAVKDGVIRLSQPNGNFGNCICLELDSGEMLYYGHLVKCNADVGQRVKKGDVVGYVGTTGNADFYHLHLEVFSDDGSLVNPMTTYFK